MTEQELWAAFCETQPMGDTPYEAWAFGAAPDKLAALVLQGIKTGTASAFPLFELGFEPLPQVGDYSVILDGAGQAKCVIQTTKLSILPFLDVPASHAYLEGEGDRSLAHWRRVHEEFFSDCLREIGLEFNENMKVLCEEFRLVYQP